MRQEKMWEEQVQTLQEDKAALQAQVQAIQGALVTVLAQAQAQGITIDVSANVGLAGSFLAAPPQPQLLPTLPVIEELPSSPSPAAVTADVSAPAGRGGAAQVSSSGNIPDSVTAAEIIAAVASRTVDGHKQGGAAGGGSSSAPPQAAAPAATGGGNAAIKRPFRALRSGCDGEDVRQMQVRGTARFGRR